MRTPPYEETDETLSRRARAGDRSAWRTIIRRHTPMVYRLAVRMLGSGAEAEDASQEVFMKALRAFDGFDATRPLAPWLGRITYHACLRRLASARQHGVATDPAVLTDLVDASLPSPEGALASREAGELMRAALGQLSAQDRALVTMRYVDGLTDLEVGEAVGMNRNTVRTRLHRARLALKQMLGAVLGGRQE